MDKRQKLSLTIFFLISLQLVHYSLAQDSTPLGEELIVNSEWLDIKITGWNGNDITSNAYNTLHFESGGYGMQTYTNYGRIAWDEVRKAKTNPSDAITSAPQIDSRRALRSRATFVPLASPMTDSLPGPRSGSREHILAQAPQLPPGRAMLR